MIGKIKVLVYQPDADGAVDEIEQDLDTMQKLVGGFVQAVPVASEAWLYCDEEALLKNVPFNRAVRSVGGIHLVHGPFFFAAHDGDGGMASLTDDQIAACRNLVEDPI